MLTTIKATYKMKKITGLTFLFLSIFLQAQNVAEKEISGIVTYDNTPLPNVNILIKNTEKGTSTNARGVYKIRAKEGDVLQFTHLNMKPIEVLIEDVTTILNIAMRASDNDLDEVVITSKKKKEQVGLYAKKPRKISSGGFNIDTKTAGYSVGYISGEDLNLAATSIGRALQGKVASFQLVVDEYGNEFAKLRNTGTLLTVKYAIWVVDGQIYEYAPPLLIENIKEVAVLRSLAGVNRFGSEAIGGAIIINTKGATFDPAKDVYSKENPYTNKEYYDGDAIPFEALTSPKPNYILELEAISDSNLTYKKYKEFLATHQDKSDFHSNVADYFKSRYNDFENYKNILLDLEAYSSSNPEVLKIVAYKYQQESLYENALAVYKKIIKLRPKHAQSYRDLINVYVELKQYKKALNIYNYYFKKGFTIEENAIGEILSHEAEALTSKLSKTNLPDEKTYDIRIVFEWSTSEAEFTLEFINPQKQAYKIEHTLSDNSELILDEKQKGYASKEFVIDGDVGGEWLVNLTYYGNKKYAPTYLKTTIFNNWGRPNEAKKTTVYRLVLKDQKTQLFKLIQ